MPKKVFEEPSKAFFVKGFKLQNDITVAYKLSILQWFSQSTDNFMYIHAQIQYGDTSITSIFTGSSVKSISMGTSKV